MNLTWRQLRNMLNRIENDDSNLDEPAWFQNTDADPSIVDIYQLQGTDKEAEFPLTLVYYGEKE